MNVKEFHLLADGWISHNYLSDLVDNFRLELECKGFVQFSIHLISDLSENDIVALKPMVLKHLPLSGYQFIGDYLVSSQFLTDFEENNTDIPDSLFQELAKLKSDNVCSDNETSQKSILLDISDLSESKILISLIEKYFLLVQSIKVFENVNHREKLELYITETYAGEVSKVLNQCLNNIFITQSIPSSIGALLNQINSSKTCAILVQVLMDCLDLFNLVLSEKYEETWPLVFRSNLEKQLEEERENLPTALHLSVLILVHKCHSGKIFQFSGNFVPAAINHLSNFVPSKIHTLLIQVKDAICKKENINSQELIKELKMNIDLFLQD